MLIRTQYPDLFLSTMLPALDELIFNKFDRFPPQYTNVFRVMDSGRSIEQTSEIAGLGLFNSLGEGEPMRYDESVAGFNKTYTHSQWGLGFKMTRVMVDDDRFGVISKLASELGRSAKETIELDVAAEFNNGFTTTGPDGQALFSASHPLVKSGGTQSNLLTTPADLDIPALELMITQFRRMKDPSGKKIRVKPRRLIVPPELMFVAAEILGGTMRSDTANNTVNAFKQSLGAGFGEFTDFFVYDYLTDPDAWFVSAAQEDTELRFYWRERPNTVHDVDFDSRSVKTAMWYRMSHGWSSFYGVAGTAGA
jgi:phage major head subunit gpT-like protein